MPGPSRRLAGVAVACGRASPSVVAVALLGLALPAVVEARTGVTSAAGGEAGAQSPIEEEAGLPPRVSPLGNRWAIGVSDVVFDIRPHHPTYILPASYTGQVNRFPGSPTRPAGRVPLPWDETEGKFQLSFKFKLADFGDSIGASLWAGYTQQSQWQVYNAEASRSFRETNYQPEFMLAFHPEKRVLGFDWRLLNVSLVHQ